MGARPQLVMSAVVNLAQATEPKSTMYTPNDSRPCSSSVVSIGVRSSESNDSHQCVGRYGPMEANCGMLSHTSLATARIRIRGDRADGVLGEAGDRQPDGAEHGHGRRHIEHHEQQPQQPLGERDGVAGQQRHRADGKQDRPPMISAEAAASAHAASANMTTAVYLTLSSLARPAWHGQQVAQRTGARLPGQGLARGPRPPPAAAPASA